MREAKLKIHHYICSIAFKYYRDKGWMADRRKVKPNEICFNEIDEDLAFWKHGSDLYLGAHMINSNSHNDDNI